jgi:hypothetical protein
MTARRTVALAVAVTAATLLVACGDDESSPESQPVIAVGNAADYDPDVDPANFVDGIDNPYLPFVPGSRWVYEEESDGETERIEVVVTDERRDVMGISATVVRDTVTTEDGELIEDTFDWYAQDKDGNVWYLGEDTKEYEDGEVVSTEGSWEAGVDGAVPGIIMEADPTVGDAYRQEFYEGEAEDLAEVVRVGASESVEFGDFDDLIVIKEWNPLEPDVVEEKYFARGIGLVLEVKIEGAEGRGELIEHTKGEGS